MQMPSGAESERSTPPAGDPAGDTVRCEHADPCGGCPLIALPYRDQLEAKRARVVHALARHPSLAGITTLPVAPADPFVGYRTRAKLVVGDAEGDVPAALGLFGKGGDHRVVDLPRCRVLSPAIAAAAAAVRASIRAAPHESPLAPLGASERGAVRAVDLREVVDGAARVLVTLVVQRARMDDAAMRAIEREARALMRACPEIAGVAASLHEGDGPQVLGGHATVLAGAASASDRVGASTHLATFGSFVQAHRGQARWIHEALREAVTRGCSAPAVLDLYGGSGAIAFALAESGARVTLVESFGPAAERARQAAESQRLPVTIEHGDAGHVLRRLVERAARFDAVIVNPPRRGTSPSVRAAVARLDPDIVAYVSCDPDTLARDLAHLRDLGYAADAAKPVDMIPLTEEVETLVVLRRAPPPPPRVAFEDETMRILDKAPHASVSRALLGLDEGASGVVVVARDGAQASAWRTALASPGAKATYLVGVRGVPHAKGSIGRPARAAGGRGARPRYRRVLVAGGHSILEVTCEPPGAANLGRDLAFIGHPVLGDERHGHGATNRHFEEKAGLDRPFVHRHTLELAHPSTGARVTARAPLPGDLRGVVERLGGEAAAWLEREAP
jgi:23S rRNA (uracil1939-C5)-methyltransferase